MNAERVKSKNLFDSQIRISNSDDLKNIFNIYNKNSEDLKNFSFSKNGIKNHHINGLLITCTDEKGKSYYFVI